MYVCLYHDRRACLSFLVAVSGLLEEIGVCLAELIAGATSAAYLGDVLKKVDISTYSAEGSLVKKVDTSTSGMGRAGNGSSGEENEHYWKKHDAIVLYF